MTQQKIRERILRRDVLTSIISTLKIPTRHSNRILDTGDPNTFCDSAHVRLSVSALIVLHPRWPEKVEICSADSPAFRWGTVHFFPRSKEDKVPGLDHLGKPLHQHPLAGEMYGYETLRYVCVRRGNVTFRPELVCAKVGTK